ncbi:MAG: hypothetical protein WCF04_15660 [Candidatus Nanopelagicales bacterium]
MRWRREPDSRVARLLEGVRGERALAWGELVDGSVAVCTEHALYTGAGARIPWDLVVRAAWSEEFLDLVAQSAPGSSTRQMRLRFRQAGEVPAVVRERVEWTVLASQHADLEHPDGRSGGATLNARRSPESGEVRWAIVFDRGLDTRDPGWREAADRALAELRSRMGV